MLQVRSNPVPGGQHTTLRIAGYYVNPGLLRRISMVRIASAVAASQRRAGLRPALSRRIAPGRWTRIRPRTARRRWFGRGYWAWIASCGSQ
ncbi:MAG: hypothetical protein LBM98_02600 [Oscillospiraceae bacterium]|nr:hypothetical protein [Oscillospiraceae bacterium]